MPVWDSFLLAQTHYARGELAEAFALYRQVLAEQPDHAPSLHILGMILYQNQQFPMAAELLGRSVAVDPKSADAQSAFGMALQALGRTDEAVAHFETSLRLQPDSGWAHAALGLSLQQAKRFADAEAAQRRALALAPNLSMAQNGLGLALLAQDRPAAAAEAFESAAAIDPDNAMVHNNLALARIADDDREGAIRAFERATELAPNFVEALGQLAATYRAVGRVNDAADALERVLRARPDSPEGHVGLGDVRSDQYRMREAWQHYERAVSVAAVEPGAAQTYLCSLLYQPGLPATFVDAEHDRMARVFAPQTPTRPVPVDADANRPLRVGFVSPDLREHAVARFLVGLFEHHDRTQFSFFAYSNTLREDAVTRRLQADCAEWRNITKLTDDAAAAVITADRPDFLIDLAGYTTGGRPALLARRLAPAQASFLGYAHATALASEDFRLSDAVADPPQPGGPGGENQVVHIDGCAWQYTPDPRLPDVVPPPCLNGPRVTFGSLNNFAKLSDRTVACWADVLHAVPGARLLLKSSQPNGNASAPELRRAFAAHGIDPLRVDVRPYAKDFAEHVALFAEIDVALDPFPYNGTTTTCDALWMGLPLVALRGDTHAARVSLSLLTAMDLTEWVADTEAAYVALATRLAGDRVTLTKWRQRLRPMMSASPLNDAPGYARRFEAALRRMWQQTVAAVPA